MVYGHLLDSLVIAPYLSGKHLLDVGSGAGLPGIPLAIMRPEQKWTLIDKNNKKTRFLTQVVAELNVTNVTVIHDRTEHFHTKELFDNIVSRAFGSLNFFVKTTAHLLHPHGMLIAMKGKIAKDELENIPKDFVIKDIIPLEIIGLTAERHIIRIEKDQSLSVRVDDETKEYHG